MQANSEQNETNNGLADLWNRLIDYPIIRVHQTMNFGHQLVHVLDEEGRELARRIESTGHWEWWKSSPEKWTPRPDEYLVEHELGGDEKRDRFQQEMLDITYRAQRQS
ncbi:hypothetical protein [Enterobacter sp.]|uniref:hypothetical protein n=1 Tax=Enterobacter sp. TaxID=42895 RepID=UPI00296F42F1|nr:hypothetical protein [Enterobacter sp.]